MGFLDDLLGNTSADAAKKAAADTFAKQNAATSSLKDFGSNYSSRFVDLSKSFAPWQATGGDANDALRRLLTDPSSVRGLPGYQFGLDEGNRNIAHAGAANGNLFSGKTGKAFENFGVNYADKTYGDHLSRLLGVSQQGLDATGRGVATEGAGLTGELGARTSAYGGDMTAAGTIGQGDVAGANAKTQGIQNLLGTAAFLGGSALSGGTGGMSSIAQLLKKSNMGSSYMGGGSPTGYGR